MHTCVHQANSIPKSMFWQNTPFFSQTMAYAEWIKPPVSRPETSHL
jgi:hypothetical protein